MKQCAISAPARKSPRPFTRSCSVSSRAPVRRLGAPKCAVPFAKVLEDAYLVQPADIVAGAKALMG